jgi:NAD(P)-dependent dehydrogenase (short-subunit alcohol dehydrogenase family)
MTFPGLGSKGLFNTFTVERGLIVGVGSDIGKAIALDWIERGIEVVGTYRRRSSLDERLTNKLSSCFFCDVSDLQSIGQLISTITLQTLHWNYLVICTGTMEPMGRFQGVSIDSWCKSIEVNLLATMRLIHGLLPMRQNTGDKLPLVILFAGGGTNSAPTKVSSYTLSKIALIKAVELLDAEIPDTKFTIIGPGWVKTKIHQETLRAYESVSEAARETERRLRENDFVPMDRVIQCISWLMSADRNIIGGRNFSVAHDKWFDAAFTQQLAADRTIYKLRRATAQQEVS